MNERKWGVVFFFFKYFFRVLWGVYISWEVVRLKEVKDVMGWLSWVKFEMI